MSVSIEKETGRYAGTVCQHEDCGRYITHIFRFRGKAYGSECIKKVLEEASLGRTDRYGRVLVRGPWLGDSRGIRAQNPNSKKPFDVEVAEDLLIQHKGDS